MDAAVRSHKDLEAWKAAVTLAQNVYRVTDEFGKAEQFGLTLQMRRSAVSIASNIAEGAARKSTKELIQFLYVASGSASELHTQAEIAKRLFERQTTRLEQLQAQVDAVSRMVRALIKSLQARSQGN